MIAQNNVTHLLVGKDLNILANTSTRADLAIGQIGVFLVGSKVAKTTALSAGDRFTVVTKNSKGVLVESPVIEYSNIAKKSYVDYAAATQRSRAIGFNGTSGSIDEQNNAQYVAHIFWYDNSKTFGYGKPVKFAAYLSSSAATQVEIAAGLVQNFNKNFSRENPKILKAEVLINSAGTAVATGVDTIVFKNGSKYFTATNIDDATGTAAMVVGDYIRIGTAVTDPCYKIVAIDAVNNIGTIDTPFQGADISGLDTTYELVVAATAATSDAGVKLTALPTTGSFVPGVIKYDITEFEVELKQDFGATTTSSITTPSSGSGTYWEVAENEWFLKGNRGEAWRVGNYPKDLTLEAVSGDTYNQITLNYATNGAKTIDRTVQSFGSLMIATKVPGTGGIYASLKTVFGL